MTEGSERMPVAKRLPMRKAIGRLAGKLSIPRGARSGLDSTGHEWDLVHGARLEVQAPDPIPVNGEVARDTEGYAVGLPSRPAIPWAATEAAKRRSDRMSSG